MLKGILFVCCLYLLSGCHSRKMQVRSFSPAGFERLLQKDMSVQLVDVRRPDEYETGHINDAVLINVEDADFIIKADSLLDKSKPVAVYCRSGKRSRNAAEQLIREGYKVNNLDNGYIGWTKYVRLKEE